MRQFDVFANPNPKTRRESPYIVILQSDAAMGPQTAVAAPLSRKTDVPASDRIVVPVQINGEAFVVLFQSMAAISIRLLGQPLARFPELDEHVPRAIDYLFLGM